MRRFTVALLGASALSLLTPASVRAAAFFIDDTRSDEQILFSANDFEGGILVGGVPLQAGLGNPGSLLLPEADAQGNPIVYNFQGRWITVGAALPPPVQVAFIEPGTSLLSDVLFVQYVEQGGGIGQINGHFVSDSTEQGLDPSQYLVTGVPVTNWPETNGPFFFNAPFLSGAANSDVEVPEPASFGLLAFGAGALFLRRRAFGAGTVTCGGT